MKRNSHTKVNSQFLVRVIKNETGLEEQEYFEKWFAESDENKDEFSNVALLWDMFSQSNNISVPDPEIQWENILNRINQNNHSEAAESQTDQPGLNSFVKYNSKKFRTDYSWILRLAAVIIITFSVFLIHDSYYVPQSDISKSPEIGSSSITFQNIKTYRGQRTTFTLPDGSVVYMNSESRIIYPAQFTGNERRVELTGEAYIKVEPDYAKPFIVECGSITTIVTGTEFNLMNRDNVVKVAVAYGSVKVISSNKNEILVQKGQMVSLDKKGYFSNPQQVDLSHILAWKNNKLSFKRTPLMEVIRDLELFYNVKVTVVNKTAKNKKLTGLFDAESLNEVLENLELALDISIKKDGQKIFIY